MEWMVTIEGPDEFGEIQRAQLQIDKGFERFTSGEIGLSIDDGKKIMSALQEFVVKHELASVPPVKGCGRLRTTRCGKFGPCLGPSL
jgi:hypothetical protein